MSFFLFCADVGRTSPHLDTLTTSSILDLPVQAPPSAASAPPAPVGQRSQVGAPAIRPTITSAGSQKPPDLLEQRKGRDTLWSCNVYFPERCIYAASTLKDCGHMHAVP